MLKKDRFCFFKRLRGLVIFIGNKGYQKVTNNKFFYKSCELAFTHKIGSIKFKN